MAIKQDGGFNKHPAPAHQRIRYSLDALVTKQRKLCGELVALQAEMAQLPHAQRPEVAEKVVKAAKKMEAVAKDLEKLKKEIFGA